jgi:3-hydroxyacyl-[acyl-carrier-protein] dehydratase
MPPPPHMDPAQLDLSQILVGREELRKVNPQRFEMEQLDAIVYLDRDRHLLAGYKDVRPDEFWVRGHLPEFPLMPGVLICEAAAQLCSYFMVTEGYLRGDFVGFGGLEEVRFRGIVQPGDRLVLVGKGLKLDPRRAHFNVQGFVHNTMVFQGGILGHSMKRPSSVASKG